MHAASGHPQMVPPCTLLAHLQMIALRYGAIPVVRATGGLADTVKDIDAGSQVGAGCCLLPPGPYRWGLADLFSSSVILSTNSFHLLIAGVQDDGGGPVPNGFVFEGIDAGSLYSALDRALNLYKRCVGARARSTCYLPLSRWRGGGSAARWQVTSVTACARKSS